MPIYEYRCEHCGHEMEALQKISDAPLVDCPACGKKGLKKLVSAAGFRLKGGGWYETDFKSGSKRNLAGEGDASASKAKDSATTSASSTSPSPSSSGGGSGDKAA